MKPGSSESGAVLAQARASIEAFNRARIAPSEAAADSRKCFAQVRAELVAKVLSEIDLDQIKTVTGGRVRIDSLRVAGYKNVYAVSQRTVSQLQAVPGIGETTAVKVLAAAQQLADAGTKNLFVRIDPKTRPASHAALLEAVRQQERVDRLAAQHGQSFDAGQRLMLSLVLQANLSEKSAFSRLFAGRKQRSAAADALDSLGATLSSQDLISASEIASSMIGIPAQQTPIWEDFAARAPEFSAYLTPLGVQEADAAASVGHLPAHIVEAVRAQPLDESMLDVRLRGYQSFGARYALVQRNTLLGDEMGLGKTIQALAVMGHLASQDRQGLLVVCPSAVVANWVSEVRRKSRMEPVMIHGPRADRMRAFRRWTSTGGVGVMSFETARAMHQDGSNGDSPLAVLVVDEAHYMKNPAALRSQAVARIIGRSERTMFMSGTPMENRLDEFFSLVSYLQPKLVTAATQSMSATALAAPAAFRASVAPVYLRRNQVDVLSELPERIESDEWLSMGPSDQSAYWDAVRSGNFMAMRRAVTVGDGHTDSAKLERLDEIVREATEEGRKVLVFSFFRNVIESVSSRLPSVFGPIHGSVPALTRQKIIDDFTAATGPAVLVAQIQAGGTGLNIQAASTVVLMEPQVKPSLEEQAIARAHRMGQTRRVQVFRLLASDSVDERMVEILQRKSVDFDRYARDSSVKDAAPDAVDVSDTTLAAEIILAEQKRLADRERQAANPQFVAGGGE